MKSPRIPFGIAIFAVTVFIFVSETAKRKVRPSEGGDRRYAQQQNSHSVCNKWHQDVVMLTAVVVVVVVNLLARSFVIAAAAAAVVLDQSVQSGLQNTHTQ